MSPCRLLIFVLFVFYLCLSQAASAADLPPIGEWDGVTQSAKLDRPYEDPLQACPPFGIISYFNQPWRSYMDTWPASQFTQFCGTQWNVNAKYLQPLCQLFQESGIRNVRYEIGWGNMGWDDEVPAGMKANMKRDFTAFQQHGIRPLILLNAHHGAPCPIRYLQVEVLEDAKPGDRTLKLKSTDGIRPFYTGIMDSKQYIASHPMITQVDADGTVHLSKPLPDYMAIKAGKLTLTDLKYQPFQGEKLKDGTTVPAAQDTFNGWMKYVAAIAKTAREVLGTEGKPDAGFDIEVWNEQTFGSNFLRINNYYEPKLDFAEPFVYRHTREMKPGYAPNAKLAFEQKDCYAILPMTIDYFNDPANGFPGVRVVSGFANQWPWDNGADLWDGQAGFSRHFYTGGWWDCTPEKPLYGVKNSGVIDALGQFEGKKDGKDWHTVEPGSFFIPTFRLGTPEYWHTGFKTEMISRDVIPDSRLAGFRGHGRYTHNGDFRTAEVWQTEVNYDRNPFIDMVAKDAGVKRDDPRLDPAIQRLAGKTMLRQYLFHAHKGLKRIYIFCAAADPSLGMLPKAFYDELDKNGAQLTPEARKLVPAEFTGLGWIMKQMDAGEKLDATRALSVNEIVEYKPRLVYAGDGTAAHPHKWNRDQFAFLPFQLSAKEYMIPYYVVTLDISRVWDKTKDPLDPARYDMPEQEFDVTIGNIAGKGAVVSAYDPLSNTEVPVKVVASTPTTLTVRVKSVDYPRVLKVTEAKPGPVITEPKVEVDEDGLIHVSWRTNIEASCSVTYGQGWQNREVEKAGPVIHSAITAGVRMALPDTVPPIRPKAPGVVAVRIRAEANGLVTTWPHWDEDPAGQVVVPGEPEKAAGTPK